MLVTFAGQQQPANLHSKPNRDNCLCAPTTLAQLHDINLPRPINPVIFQLYASSKSLPSRALILDPAVELPSHSTLVPPQHHISSASTRLRQKHEHDTFPTHTTFEILLHTRGYLLD
jgi:hypothetical protein